MPHWSDNFTGTHTTVKTRRDLNYAYYFSPPSDGKPVLLFAHGFPSNSYVWRNQVAFFEPKGYGLIVPDMLGYGGTDKPYNAEPSKPDQPAGSSLYTGSGLAQDIADILDAVAQDIGLEKLRVITISHDWGSYLAARLINHHSDRVAACAFLAVGYGAPGPAYKEAITVKENPMYKTFAYIRFFIEEDAAAVIKSNIDSFIHLVYPRTPQIWKDNMSVEGGVRAWIEGNKKNPSDDANPTGHPWYMTPEYVAHEKALLDKDIASIAAPLCWYKGIFLKDKATDDLAREAYYVKQPLLYVAFTLDPISLPILADMSHAHYAKGPVTRKEIEGDHWALESHPGQLSTILEDWIESDNVQNSIKS